MGGYRDLLQRLLSVARRVIKSISAQARIRLLVNSIIDRPNCVRRASALGYGCLLRVIFPAGPRLEILSGRRTILKSPYDHGEILSKRARRQHVVSKFYLKGFANTSDRVCRVTLPGEQSHSLSISDAGVIKDFYTITLPDGSQSDAFERAFGNVEGSAAEAFRAIVQGIWPLTGERRAALAEWIALQHLRSEDVRASQGAMNAEMIRLIVGVSGKEALRRVIEKAEGRSVSEEELDWEWRDITKPGGPDLEPNVREHLQLLMSLLDGTSRYLHDCHWTLYRFSRRALITSDHPVSLLVDSNYPSWQGIGIVTADLFLVPLSRRLALTIQPRHRLPTNFGAVPDFIYPGTTKLARSINQETALGARRYIYHHLDDSPLEGLFLPAPEARKSEVSGVDGLICEEGLFCGMTEEQRKSFSRPLEAGGEKKGLSIADLPWPIPGRKKSVRTQEV